MDKCYGGCGIKNKGSTKKACKPNFWNRYGDKAAEEFKSSVSLLGDMFIVTLSAMRCSEKLHPLTFVQNGSILEKQMYFQMLKEAIWQFPDLVIEIRYLRIEKRNLTHSPKAPIIQRRDR
ncbi:hypothetical protein GCM10009001_01360 [Virgibacillus siamensis]|uniref:Uncharacterized protein n=1 Tax=Virgibacillus siamensis TaxID=480071 RepID=A0ABN1FEL2_9BACI